MEKRFREHNMAVIERNTNIATAQLDSIAKEMKQSLLRTMAYKEVVARKTFSKITDRNERLNGKYTAYAMRFEINDQLKKLEPTYVRQQKARDQIDKSKRLMDKVIRRNLRTILSPRARERKRLMRELDLERNSTYASLTPSPPPLPAVVSRQNTKGMIVTKDQLQLKNNKGGSTSRTEPAKMKLPPINLAKTPREGRSMGLETERPAKDTRLKLPPIKQMHTVR